MCFCSSERSLRYTHNIVALACPPNASDKVSKLSYRSNSPVLHLSNDTTFSCNLDSLFNSCSEFFSLSLLLERESRRLMWQWRRYLSLLQLQCRWGLHGLELVLQCITWGWGRTVFLFCFLHSIYFCSFFFCLVF